MEYPYINLVTVGNSFPMAFGRRVALENSSGSYKRIGSIRMVPSLINSFDSFRHNINACQRGHPCLNQAARGASRHPIPNLMLIDCARRRVVKATAEAYYLALSYVWGDQRPPSVPFGSMLLSLPQTIEYAITVTTKLGFHYLWVDAYCINQDSVNDVSIQIRHMDLVYQRAQATIIAAAGSNADFGLPEVSSPRQKHQVCTTVNGVHLASLRTDPWQLVHTSVWNSRA